MIGALLEAGLLDDRFLTLSPILAGRSDVRTDQSSSEGPSSCLLS